MHKSGKGVSLPSNKYKVSDLLAKRKYKEFTNQELEAFILMVLLDEGKSNLHYKLLRCLAGVRFANRYYIKRLFSGSRFINYSYYRDKFEKEQEKHFL